MLSAIDIAMKYFMALQMMISNTYGSLPLEMNKEQFYKAFTIKMNMPLPRLVPFKNSLDIKIDNMWQLYRWAFFRDDLVDKNIEIIMKWYPGKEIVIGWYDNKYWHSLDSINLDFNS